MYIDIFKIYEFLKMNIQLAIDRHSLCDMFMEQITVKRYEVLVFPYICSLVRFL